MAQNLAFDFRQTAVKNAHEMRRNGFGQEKSTDEGQIGNILEGLASIGEDMKNHYPRISESKFKSTYLDAFAGFGKSVEDNYALYLQWLFDVAKQFNIPVHVCDDSDDRNVLFTVPAITNVKTINPQKSRNEEIQYAVSTANEARFLQPYKWEAMLAENLHGIFKKAYDSANAVTDQQQVWLDIFKRYEDHFKGRKQLDGFDKNLMVEGQNAKSPAQAQADYSESDEEV